MHDADLPTAGQTETGAKARGPSRGIILHVEDDYEVRLATGALLKAAGFDAREAWSGESALAQAESLTNKLDVLIVDYHLGGDVSGTEVAEFCHPLPGLRDTHGDTHWRPGQRGDAVSKAFSGVADTQTREPPDFDRRPVAAGRVPPFHQSSDKAVDAGV